MAANTFYGPFDTETLPGSVQKKPGDCRSAFEIDRDRIVFSYAFRRLQSKTQVFQSGEFDFYRTRLTHSLEVSKIGRSLCHFLEATSPLLRPDFHVDPDLVEAICLAHDLGHPPFGHIGERTLNRLMADCSGFEGNAQTLRILTSLIYERESTTEGMCPTRALLDGILKYKTLHRELLSSGQSTENHFLYDDQEALRAFALGSELIPSELDQLPNLNSIRSIECQIMDWADDTAYSLNDVVDGVEARYLTPTSLQRWAEGRELSGNAGKLLGSLIESIRDGYCERRLNSRIRHFIQASRIEEVEDGVFADRSNRYRFRLRIDPAVSEEAELYKTICGELIFQSPQIQQIELKGRRILESLFQTILENYAEARPLHILPPRWHGALLKALSDDQRRRLACDFVSGLTDGLAVRYYKRWFDPDHGSILDFQ